MSSLIVGIVRAERDQRVDGRRGLGRVGAAVPGDGAGEERGLGGVAGGILAEGLRRALEEGVELGHHPAVPVGVLGRGRVAGRQLRDAVLDQRDAVAPERVVLRVGVGIGAEHLVLAAEMVEDLEHRVGVAAGGGEVAQAGLVGARLLGAAVGEQRCGAPPGWRRRRWRRRRRARRRPRRRRRRACRWRRCRRRRASAWSRRAWWPPVMWPSSWAITARTWSMLPSSVSSPVLTKMFWPPATKALGSGSCDDVEPHGRRVDPGGAEERVGDALQAVLDLGVADQGGRCRRRAARAGPAPGLRGAQAMVRTRQSPGLRAAAFRA